MSTFLGIGVGPIQTGIFVPGAMRGGFSRIVVADVDKDLVACVRANDGKVRINVAHADGIEPVTLEGIEILNPLEDRDRTRLVEAAAQANEIATALPSVAFYRHISDWLGEGLARNPDHARLVYASENHNRAAELLAEAVAQPAVAAGWVNTVIGKMSGVLTREECDQRGVLPLTAESDRGHMVEAFNRILVHELPGVERRRVEGLCSKADLLPFEEAKLYGHNAIHVLLGLHAWQNGMTVMHEAARDEELMALAREAFVDESGAALCRKWGATDALFAPEGFAQYADDLLARMTNRFLGDRVDRVCRDLERKLGWEDRLVGAIRLARSQDVPAPRLTQAAAMAARRLWGTDAQAARAGLKQVWGEWDAEKEAVREAVLADG